ncbi:unnamed protein product [Schistocephalus solidus]|uniref:SHSP domain-containing protein n=1 Tax=Schistocephalus solidus TaxID=70667 RepID=A0A183SJB8_SCHSO|nr:unnamed protein product [Schistocephalus solidus]
MEKPSPFDSQSTCQPLDAQHIHLDGGVNWCKRQIGSLQATIGENLRYSQVCGDVLVVNSHKLVASSQLHLPQHRVHAVDSSQFQDLRVKDPVLPSQLQYTVEAAEMAVIKLPGLVRVDAPGLESVKVCRHDISLVHLFCVQMNTVAIPHGGLQSAESLTGFGDSLETASSILMFPDSVLPR